MSLAWQSGIMLGVAAVMRLIVLAPIGLSRPTSTAAASLICDPLTGSISYLKDKKDQCLQPIVLFSTRVRMLQANTTLCAALCVVLIDLGSSESHSRALSGFDNMGYTS